MSWASFEDFCAEIPVITPIDPLCIECEKCTPEPGADHCQRCLDKLNEQAWDSVYGRGSPVSERQRLQDEMKIALDRENCLVTHVLTCNEAY